MGIGNKDSSTEQIFQAVFDPATQSIKISGSGGGGGGGTITLTGDATGSGTSTIPVTISGLDATKIATGTVNNTKFGYLQNVTSDIQTQLDLTGQKYVRSTRFASIASGTSGTVALPGASTVITNDFGGGTSALICTEVSTRPTFQTAVTTTGVLITATFDSSGNYTLSGVPSAYPVDIIYRVRQKIVDFDSTSSSIIGDYATEDVIPTQIQANKVAVFTGTNTITTANTTTTEINYVSGVTSPIQTQFNNLNIFKTISVAGQSDVVADNSTDTLTLVAGSNMTITTNASTDTITFTSAGGGGGVTDGDKGDIVVSGSGTVWTIDSASSPTVTNFTISALASASNTQNGIIYTNTSGQLTSNPSNLLWDSTNNRLGINMAGTTASATLDIHQNGTTVPGLQVNNIGAQGTTAGGVDQVVADSGSAMLINNRLGAYQFSGAVDAAHTVQIGAAIAAHATENWSSTAAGTRLTFNTTQNATLGRVTALTLNQDQSATFANTVNATTFVGTLNGTGQVNIYNNGSLIGSRRNINFIPGTNVTYTIADNSGSDRVDVTINSSGSGTFGKATIDFGYRSGTFGEDGNTSVTVNTASVSTTSKILLTLQYDSALTDHDPEDYAIENITVSVGSIVNGVSFDINASAPRETWGRYGVTYTIG